MLDQNFESFLASLWDTTSLRQWQGIVDLALDAIVGWPAETCVAWVRRLEANPRLSLDDSPFSTEELAQKADDIEVCMQLLEVLLARLATLGAPDALDAVSELLSEATCTAVRIGIPRRYLVAVYMQWIDGNFLPGVSEYHAQFVRLATAQEKVAAAKRALAVDNEVTGEMGPLLVADALPHLLRLEPELLPQWLDLLEGTTTFMADPQVVAKCGRYRALWRRIPFGAEMPTALNNYFAAGELNRNLVADARSALDGIADDVVRMPKHVLGMLVERDMLLLMGQLPTELELIGCDEAKSLLRDYRRLLAFGVSTPLNLSLMLTRAIEAQLHHALSFGHGPEVRRRIEREGLATLAEFVMGSIERLSGFAVRPKLAQPDWEALNRAGKIRNWVHHEPSRVCGADVDHLHRAIFDTDSRAPQLLKKLGLLRCARMG
jgi:hypothetical protein